MGTYSLLWNPSHSGPGIPYIHKVLTLPETLNEEESAQELNLVFLPPDDGVPKDK
jgi:hypothetical protein